MRITTQMLNETAKRTGIPVNQTSLLSYMNQSSSSTSSGSGLLDALNKNQQVSSAAAAADKKLEQAADSLKAQSEKLAAKGEDSFFEKIRESGSTEELYSAVESYVRNYNAALFALDKSNGTLNQYYGGMLKEAAEDSSELLKGVGITVGADGALSINEEKLKAASVDDIESVFGAAGGLTSKTAFLAGRVSDQAQASMQSLSSRYDVSGSLYSQLASRFDFWG